MQAAAVRSAALPATPPLPQWRIVRRQRHRRHQYRRRASSSLPARRGPSHGAAAASSPPRDEGRRDRPRAMPRGIGRPPYSHDGGSLDAPSSSFPRCTPSGRRLSTTTGPSVLSKEAATAPLDYPASRRLRALPPAVAIHLSIGSVYVYSMWTPGMSKTLGVVAAAPCDWTHSELLPVFSAAAVVLGATTSALGEWVERVGPRTAGTVGSALWGGALLTTAAGVEAHSLPVVYLGYGLLGGVGWGLMYLTPVTSAMKWFPDRRG